MLSESLINIYILILIEIAICLLYIMQIHAKRYDYLDFSHFNTVCIDQVQSFLVVL